MLGTILAVALLASADAEIAPHAVLPGGGDQHFDGATWSGPVTGMGALGLVGGDVVAWMAGAALIGLTSGNCNDGGFGPCVNNGAAIVALIGIATIPPALALLLGREQARSSLDGRAVILTAAAQAAAIGLFLGGLATSAGPWRTGLLVSAAAFHFVGIPLAVGMVPARAAQGAASERGTPTLSLALSW